MRFRLFTKICDSSSNGKYLCQGLSIVILGGNIRGAVQSSGCTRILSFHVQRAYQKGGTTRKIVSVLYDSPHFMYHLQFTCNSPAIFCNTRENVGRQRRFPGSEGTISCKNSTIRQINAPHSSCWSLPHKNTASRMLCLRKE